MTGRPTSCGAWLRRSLPFLAGLGLLVGAGTGRTAGASSPPSDPLPAAPTAGDPTPADSLLTVVPQDGRPAQPVRIHRKGDAAYVSLLSVGRALGVRYTWDPYTYRGWIETDTLQTRFTLKSPILTHGNDGWQLREAIDYDEHGVLIPTDYFELLSERWNAGRSVLWKPEAAMFVWGKPAVRYDRIELTESGHESHLRIHGAPPPQSTLLWSPLGGLEVFLEGWAADPGSLAIDAERGRLSVRSVRGLGNGSRIRLDAAPSVVAVSTDYDEREQTWQLLATTSATGTEGERFARLEHAMLQNRATSGAIVLACWVDPVNDPPGGATALRDLAQEIATNLSGPLGQETVILEGMDAFRMAGRANGYDARCVIGLRIDHYQQGAGQVQIWMPIPRFHWRVLESREEEEVPESIPLFWSEVPAISAAGSERLASTLSAHMKMHLGEEGVVSGKRPSRWLEGLAMPAVAIYPAMGSDPASLQALEDPGWRADLARAIAFGIAEGVRASSPDGVSP